MDTFHKEKTWFFTIPVYFKMNHEVVQDLQ